MGYLHGWAGGLCHMGFYRPDEHAQVLLTQAFTLKSSDMSRGRSKMSTIPVPHRQDKYVTFQYTVRIRCYNNITNSLSHLNNLIRCDDVICALNPVISELNNNLFARLKLICYIFSVCIIITHNGENSIRAGHVPTIFVYRRKGSINWRWCAQ
jgi:hypothetical protein